MQGKMLGKILKIIYVVDSNLNIDPNSNLSGWNANGNVTISNPDTELPELIQACRGKLNKVDARGVGGFD